MNILKVEKLSSEQNSILEKMLKEEKIDSFTYTRMKKALQVSLNQKLKKINAIA